MNNMKKKMKEEQLIQFKKNKMTNLMGKNKQIIIKANKVPFISRKTEAPYHSPKKKSKIVINHGLIKKVEDDIKGLKYNTAVSTLMTLLNAYEKQESITKDDYLVLLKLLNPMAPHITEELNAESLKKQWLVNVENVLKYTEGKEIVKVIVIKNKIVSIVIK